MNKLLACLVILILVAFGFPKNLRAQETTLSTQVTGGQIDEAVQKIVPIRFLPTHTLYFLITIKENVSRFFKPSHAQRAEFDFVLSGKRLKETYLMLSENSQKANKNLLRYTKRLKKMVVQIEKARSQNQDIAQQVARISEDFRYQEILLIYLLEKNNLLENLDNATSEFKQAVLAVDRINPGIKNRYKLLNDDESKPTEEPKSSPSPILTPTFNEASPSVQPKRIIF